MKTAYCEVKRHQPKQNDKRPSNKGCKPSHTQTRMQILNPSTSAGPVMTKLQNLLAVLVNMDIFQMTPKFSQLTVD